MNDEVIEQVRKTNQLLGLLIRTMIVQQRYNYSYARGTTPSYAAETAGKAVATIETDLRRLGVDVL